MKHHRTIRKQLLTYRSNIIKAPPADASQTCNERGHIDKQNRRTRAECECIACGHRDSADINTVLKIMTFGHSTTVCGSGKATGLVKRKVNRAYLRSIV